MKEISRRRFLVRTGWVAGGVTVIGGCGLVPVLPTFSEPGPEDGLRWVQLRSDGRVRFLCPRSEMGQGASTGLAQVVAEELGVALADVDCVYPTTADIAPARMTVGSESIEKFFEPTARAAAALRETLRRRAAARLDVGAEALTPVPSGFQLADGSVLRYAELVEADEDSVLFPAAVDPPPPLLSLASRPRLVGTPQPMVRLRSLVTGAERFSRDVRLPDMVFGAVARPPFLGARLEAWDAAAARGVAGVIRAVSGPGDAVGVVAETPMAARRGVEALGCRWRTPDRETLARIEAGNDVDEAIAQDLLDHEPISEGSLTRGAAEAVANLNVRYDTPMVAHAAMEPRAGVAVVTDRGCEVHTGSQDPWYVQGAVARAVGMARDRVVVHNQRIGGAFGGRIHCQATVEAAWLAAAVRRPVKVQWSREEEFRYNYVGPAFSHRIQAGLTAGGDIAYWHHRMVGSPILTTSALIPAHLHWAADLVADPGTWRGTDLPYRAPNRRVAFADIRRPMPTGAWRGLGAAPNTFAVECAVDELAALAREDPLAFRRRHATHERLARAIEQVGRSSGWPGGDGFGIAAAAYKGVTFVAVVAKVRRQAGSVLVERLWCAHDCGLVVNPDLVRAQIEGNLAWGVSMALKEQFRLQDGIGASTNFTSYPIARNADVPPVEIELLRSDQPASGAGEAAFAPAAAAVVNALASLERSRERTLPLGEPP